MQITRIEINNFQSHKNSILEGITPFHSFIGKNDSGKTGIFEILTLLKQFERVPGRDETKITHINRNQVYDLDKDIEVDIQIKLSDEERKQYFKKYFDSSENIDLLKEIKISFYMPINKNKNQERMETKIIIKKIEVMRDERFETLLYTELDGKLKAKSIQDHRGGSINYHAFEEPFLNISYNTPGLYFDLVDDFLSKISYVQSTRITEKKTGMRFMEKLPETNGKYNGREIVNLINTFHMNHNNEFNEINQYCLKIFPNIVSITPKILGDNNITIQVKKKNLPDSIELENSGSGLEQLLIHIWLIGTSHDEIWLIDEPEVHLHPESERYLYDFLRSRTEKGIQILVTTHSMVFVHRNDLSQTTILSNEDSTVAINFGNLANSSEDTLLLEDIFKNRIYEALGYEPVFSFEPNQILLVEGYIDCKLIPIFAQRLEKEWDPKITFLIPMGDKKKLLHNAPVIASLFPTKRVMMLLDNDNQSEADLFNTIKSIKEQRRNALRIRDHLKNEDVFLYKSGFYSIESFLLEPEAIALAINKPESEDTISQIIDKYVNERPKHILKSIWNELAIGEYNELIDGMSIATKVSMRFLMNNEFNIIMDRICNSR